MRCVEEDSLRFKIHSALIVTSALATLSNGCFAKEMLMNANTKNEASWHSTEDYYRYIWNRKKVGYDGYGKISVLCKFPGSGQRIYFCLDHIWLRNGLFAKPEENGASEGALNAAMMKDGEIRTFDVSAGPHEVYAFSEAWTSNHTTVMVKAGETTHLVCSEKFSGFQQMWNKLVALFFRPAPDIYLITEATERTGVK